MTTTPQNLSAMHASSGDAKPAAPSSASNTSGPADTNSSAPPSNGGTDYPEQLHAGKVGYGPNYRAGPSLEDKIQGLKEELKGKITHKPDLVQHGREVMSGEEKKKKLTGEDEPSPFQTEDKSESQDKPASKTSTSTSGTQLHSQDQDQSKDPHQESETTQTHTHSQSQASQNPFRGSQSQTDNERGITAPQTQTQTHFQTPSAEASGNSGAIPQTQTHSQHPNEHIRYGLAAARIHGQSQTPQTQGSTRAHSDTAPQAQDNFQTTHDNHIQTESPAPGFDRNSQTLTENRGDIQDGQLSGSGDRRDGAAHLQSHFETRQSEAPTRSQGDFQTQQTDNHMQTPAQTHAQPDLGSSGPPKATPGGMAVNQGYGKGAMEQAATVAPEGTREAEMQRKGNNIDFAGRPVDVQPRQ